jgi:hypothetical protein
LQLRRWERGFDEMLASVPVERVASPETIAEAAD